MSQSSGRRESAVALMRAEKSGVLIPEVVSVRGTRAA